MAELGQRVAESVLGPEAAGLRLDVWLAKRFTYRSRAQWQQAIGEGEILLNGAKTRASRVLQAGEKVRFTPKNATEPEVDRNFSLVAENEFYAVVDKPGNLPCHPAGRYFANTLWALLNEKLGFAHIVNRLDRETSGVTLVARDGATAAKLSGLLADRKAEKVYVAIVHGEFPEGEIQADGFLFPDAKSAVDKKRAYAEKAPEGVEAESCSTSFRLLGISGGLSAVEARPHTGRLHQIRATLLSLGFPLAGDKLYGVDETLFVRQAEGLLTEADRETLLLPRQALHARELSFECPFTRRKMSFKSPPPAEMLALHRACAGV